VPQEILVGTPSEMRVGALALAAAAAAAAGAAPLAAAAAAPRAAGHAALRGSRVGGRQIPGMVYGVALNGTTNEQQFLAADLDTFIVDPRGPSLGPDVDVLGSAAAVDAAGVYWTCLYYFGQREGAAAAVAARRAASATRAVRGHSARAATAAAATYPAFPAAAGDELALVGINTTDGAVVRTIPTSSFTPTGQFLFILGIYPAAAAGSLFVVAKEPKTGVQVFVDVDTASGTATPRGNVTFAAGGDPAWDPATGTLYEIATDGSDDDSGNVTIIDTATGRVAGAIPLQNFFALPHWDPVTSSLMGLTLSQPSPGTYQRDFTLLFPQAGTYNTTDHGALGAFYAEYDGPKAWDPANRRAFFVIATSPMGEMDLVTVDIDAVPAKILESPGICGFIGYCPGGIAYSPS
jgi:hypothetical protein